MKRKFVFFHLYYISLNGENLLTQTSWIKRLIFRKFGAAWVCRTLTDQNLKPARDLTVSSEQTDLQKIKSPVASALAVGHVCVGVCVVGVVGVCVGMVAAFILLEGVFC